MAMMEASVCTTGAMTPLGILARSAWLPLVLKGLSLCASNWKSETPEKSPAMPTLPSADMSTLLDGAGAKLTASAGAGSDARAAAATRYESGATRRLRAPWRRPRGIIRMARGAPREGFGREAGLVVPWPDSGSQHQQQQQQQQQQRRWTARRSWGAQAGRGRRAGAAKGAHIQLLSSHRRNGGGGERGGAAEVRQW